MYVLDLFIHVQYMACIKKWIFAKLFNQLNNTMKSLFMSTKLIAYLTFADCRHAVKNRQLYEHSIPICLRQLFEKVLFAMKLGKNIRFQSVWWGDIQTSSQ